METNNAVPQPPAKGSTSPMRVNPVGMLLFCIFFMPWVVFAGYVIWRFLRVWPRVMLDADFARVITEAGTCWVNGLTIAVTFAVPWAIAAAIVPRLRKRRQPLACAILTLLAGTCVLLRSSLAWHAYGTHGEGDDSHTVRVVDFVPTDAQRDTFGLIGLVTYGVPAMLGALVGSAMWTQRPRERGPVYDPFFVTPEDAERLVRQYDALRRSPRFVSSDTIYQPASSLPADRATMRRALRYVYAHRGKSDDKAEERFREAYRDTALFIDDRIAIAARRFYEDEPGDQTRPPGDPVGSLDFGELGRQTQRELEHLDAEWRAYAASLATPTGTRLGV